MNKLIIGLFSIILLSSCNGDIDSEEIFGIPTGNIEIKEIHTIKIVNQTDDSTISSLNLPILGTVQVKAVLVDSTGSILQEVFINWSVTGDFSSSDLSALEGPTSRYATFTGNAPGTGFVTGVLTDSALITQFNIKATTLSTGTLTVLPSITPDEIIKISGDTQTAQVGTTLGQALKVKVLDTLSNPIVGAGVTFSITTGGGLLVTPQTVFTDGTGVAECVVKVGGLAGVSANSYTATISTGTTTSVLFTASASEGPPASISISQQPDGGNVNTQLNFQPRLEIQDTYGNKVNSANNAITVAVSTGAGNVLGTLTISAIAGLATYVDLVHDIYETNVEYTFTSPGLNPATSAPFDIGQITLYAQCVADTAGWLTIDGGCKDLSSGIVWSAVSPISYTWHQSVWDQAAPGSTVQDAQDEGRTTDSDSAYSNITDGNAVGYCHDLTESGYSDWVLPTYAWYLTARAANGDLKFKEFDAAGVAYTSYLWTSSDYHSTHAYIFLNSTLTSTGVAATTSRRVKCARFPPATQLYLSQQVGGAVYDVNGSMRENIAPFKVWENQPVVQLRDSTNSVRSISSKPVTVSLTSGTGILSGTLTVNAVNGIATFTDLSYDKAETITLTFTSPSITSVISNPIIIHPTLPKADCLIVGGVWVSGNGGCKDVISGTIYASRSPTSMNWHSAIWDSTAALATSPDSYDNGRFDEYQSSYPPLSEPDTSGSSYCHDLKESGYEDWYLPKTFELSEITGKDSHLNTRIQLAQYMWTKPTNQTTHTLAYSLYIYSTSGSAIGQWSTKTNARYVHCVRRDAPDHLKVLVQPDGGASGFGAGVVFTSQPKVQIVDATNSPHYIENITITATVVGGSGSLLLNGVDVAEVTALTDKYGKVLFDGIGYSTPGETVKLRFTADTFNYQSSSITLATKDTADMVIPSHYLPSLCDAESPGAWESLDGGCRDLQAGGLVWSQSMANGSTWYDAMWDSTIPGSEVTDLDDGAKTNDYDQGYPAPTTEQANYKNVCHKLLLNGYRDWRMPTYDELNMLTPGARNGKDFVNTLEVGGAYIWSSTPGNVDSKARMLRVSTWDWPHTTTGYTKTYSSTKIHCIREP